MEADQKLIQLYLKSMPGQFISGKEIARRAAGKSRFSDEPDWAVPVLKEMVEKGKLEKDAAGHYRLSAPKEKRGPKKWISPQMKRILEKSGKEFHEIKEEELEDSDS
jgi:hypothetical protein